MKKIQLTILFLLFSIITNAQIYVDVTALGSNNGTTWTNAYTSLTTALASAVSGNEVWVAKGTYKPTNETSPFSIPANVKIYGGFIGTETLLTERDWFTNPTILSGDLDSSTTANAGDAHTIVHFNTVNDAAINGFTIEYGYADNDATLLGRTGAGIYNDGNNKITNCVINNNNAFGNGTDNGVGGGAISFSGILEITNTVFHSNNASASGGAISVESGTANLINATIANNTATKGGGVHFFNGSMIAVNSIFTNNSGTNGNINNDGGAGTGSVSYCLFFNATATNNGNIPPSITNTGNNLENTDPLYGGRAVFSLLVNSPALDAGDNTANTTTKGLGSNNRILDADFNGTPTIDIGAYEADVIYTEITGTSLASVYFSSVKFGDIDNDGDLDILLTGDGSTSNTSKTYTNDGAGNYTLKANPIALFSQRSVAFGDIDNDGDLDIILTGNSGDPISRMYTNDGAGNYTERTYPFIYYLYDAHSSSIAFGDIDNDGDLDMLIAGFGSGSPSKTYINDGTGNYTIKANPLTGVGNSSVAFGDIDNDGDLDILLTGGSLSGNISKTYINDGAANYTEKPNPFTGVSHSSVAFGDIDNDGDLDILLTGDSGSGNISNIYTNDGTGNYTEKTNPLIGVKYSSAAFGDIDNDGDLDILLTGDTGSVSASKIYTNDGAGNYTESTHQLTNVSSSSVAFGDIDNDGDLDILLTGHPGSAAISKLYKNNTITANTAPTAPTSPTAVVNPNNTVTLSWSASTDAQTASSGLSYAIYIKENPVGTPIYVKSPMAQEADGWRKLPALGNTMQNTNYTYKLPASYCATITNFTFKVQAVDHNFTGSAFSSEGSFTVDLTTPSITTIYVKAGATGTNDGTSWTNAFTDLENAIANISMCTAQIWVAQGTYKPSSETASFSLPENIKMYGGFDGTETLLTERDWFTNPTILSGDLDNSSNANIGDAHTIVHFNNVNNAEINGFTIEYGYAGNDATLLGRTGAGIYNNGNNKITNCIIKDNNAFGNGTDNGVGGGVISFSGIVDITNTLLHSNNASANGGAISVEDGTINLINTTMVNNTATKGGGVHFFVGNMTAVNSIFSNNTGTNGNINDDGGAGTGSVSYCLFYNATATNNGNVPPSITDGGNNIQNTNPLFINIAASNFHLSATSTGIDAGNNADNTTTKGLGNNNRIIDTDNDSTATIDIGAYEMYFQFTEITGTGLQNLSRSSVAFADIDTDGDLDMLINGYPYGGGNPISKTYTNDGTGTFILKANSQITGIANSSVAFGDIDNDGDLDILFTGTGLGSTYISRIRINNGSGTFSYKSAPLTGVLQSSVAFGDIDNDGDLDILLTGKNSSNQYISKIYTNDGTGVYLEKATALIGIGEGAVAFGDIDNDGDLDVLITGKTNSSTYISKTYTNDGKGNFIEKANPFTGVYRSSAAFGDIDNDGDLDILITGYGSIFTAKTYTNDGAGSYTEKSNPLAGVLSYSSSNNAVFGDLNNDGNLDILITGTSGSGRIAKTYHNDGAGNYTEISNAFIGFDYSSVALGDIDNDGDLDVLITGNPSFTVTKLYKNNSTVANTVPIAPTSPTATVNPDNTVTLSWAASTDAQTASSGLSYNVYIKENPIGTPMYTKSPMAQEADGWRKLPTLGNGTQATNYTYKLPSSYCGTTTSFTFKVQAIDHNFTGSPFSSEGSFTVDLTSPTINTIFVKGDASGANDGTSWTNAFTNLSNAIQHIGSCTQEIWVAQGTYKPSSETTSFSVPSNIQFLGGFIGTETLATERNWSANPTILSGDLDSSNTANTGDAHTIIHLNNATNTTISGFIIEYGYADDNATLLGKTGASIYNDGTNKITHCIFRNNNAIGNGSTGNGGAIISYSGTIDITNNLFYNNTATANGGALYVDTNTVNLINNTIANNTATNGGGVHNENGNTTVVNTIFYNNSGTNGNLNDTGSGSTTASYSLFYNTTPGNNGNIPPNITDSGNNIINTDPVFKNTASNDFRLSIGSPVLNFGDNSSISYTKDLENNTRIFDTTIDIGAFEFDEIVSSWTGAISTVWNLAGNWTSGIPTSSTSVLISDNTNIATIYSGTSASAKNITINAAKSLFINGEGSLTIDGNLTNNGLLKASSGSSIIVNGTATGILNYFRNLATTNWYLISNPLKNETTANIRSNNPLAVSVSAPIMGLATYNNSSSSWEYYTLANIDAGGVLPSGKGYSTKLSTVQDFEFEGEMPTDNVAIAITDGTANRFNLIGNPYPSYIPANESAHLTNNILTVNTAQLSENTLWFWDESLNGGAGAYTQINHATPSRFIAPGQGFFVSSKVGGGTFSFTETMQSHQATDIFNKSSTNRFEINLSISDGTTTKNTEIYYINGTTTGFDNGYDSSIFGGTNTDFSLYTQTVNNNQGRKLGIQSLPDDNYENMVIPMGVNTAVGTEITFSLVAQNIPNGINIYLENKTDNTFTKLNDTDNYTTTTTEPNEIGQFYLHTRSNTLGIHTVSLEAVTVYKTDNTNLRIIGLPSEKTTIKMFTLLGKEVLHTTFESMGTKDIRLPNLSTGVYLVRLQNSQGKLTTKLIIK